MFEKLARFWACWYAKLKNWHVKVKNWHAWHVGTLIGTLASKNEKFARFWHVDTKANWHVNHAGTQARWHQNRAGTQARWPVDHVGTQARMAGNLANPVFYCFYIKQ